MPRIARKNLNASFFHIIVQGINKEYIFLKKDYMEKYIQLIDKYKEGYNVMIIAYCIMNNHAHLLIYTENIKEMAKFMHKVNGIYAQYYNKNENRVGVVFRNRYQSQPISDEKYLIECIKYIHQNPLKAGIVNKCEEYQYSTYNQYLKNIGVAKSKILLEKFEEINYMEIFNCKSEKFLFQDIEVNKTEIMQNGIEEFKKEKNKSLKEIKENKEMLKELIKYLKEKYGVTYVSMMERLDISRGQMNSLTKK